MNADQKSNHRPILIAGLPRSGTTWIGEVISSAPGTMYTFEPDNEKLSPAAWLCKSGLHRFPYFTSLDEEPAYRQLWHGVLAGSRWRWRFNDAFGLLLRRKAPNLEALVGEKCGYVYIDRDMHGVGENRRAEPFGVRSHPLMALLARPPARGRIMEGRRLIVKSVHSVLSLDWIQGNFPVQIVLVLRNPFSLYASFKRMKMPDGYRNLLVQPTLERDLDQYAAGIAALRIPDHENHIAFQIMLMYRIISTQAAKHPDWHLVSHDRLCLTLQDGYKQIFEQLGLAWGEKTGQKIASLNEAGGGFQPKRVSSQQPTRWKAEMQAEERETIDRWMEFFGLRGFFQDHVNL